MPNFQTRRAYESALSGRLRELREASGLTQREVASLLDVSQDQYRKYEARSAMPAYYLVRFALITRTDIDYLLTGVRRTGPRKAPTAEPAPSKRAPESVATKRPPSRRGARD